MKKIVIALLLVFTLMAAAGCGKTESPKVSATDPVSASDTVSGADTVSDSDPAPEGFISYEMGDLYFYYPETAVVSVSETDAFSASADAKTGANFSVTKTRAVDMNVAELDKAALDIIGQKSAAELQSLFGETAVVSYNYKNHGPALDGKGVFFAFDIAVDYAGHESTQTLSYYQLYIGKGKNLYLATFASNTLFDSDAETYFANVIESFAIAGE